MCSVYLALISFSLVFVSVLFGYNFVYVGTFSVGPTPFWVYFFRRYFCCVHLSALYVCYVFYFLLLLFSLAFYCDFVCISRDLASVCAPSVFCCCCCCCCLRFVTLFLFLNICEHLFHFCSFVFAFMDFFKFFIFTLVFPADFTYLLFACLRLRLHFFYSIYFLHFRFTLTWFAFMVSPRPCFISHSSTTSFF